MQSFCVSYIDLTYDLTPIRTINITNQLASEIASDAVNFCINHGVVNYEGYDKSGAIYIVKCSINNVVKSGKCDEIVQEEYVDFSIEMRQILEERERQKQERERLAREAYEAHLQESVEREIARNAAMKTSFEFLYSFLNEEERKEAIEKKQVTVKIAAGEFVVPLHPSMVRHYLNGKHMADYCIVFSDYSIPFGDEVLMKIALLKTDPLKFFGVANKFPVRS
jgi:hypothetical protein